MTVRRTRRLLAGAGMISMLFGALMVVAPSGAGAQDHVADPPGNNGTVKIDGLGLDDGPGHSGQPNDPDETDPDNDPHIGCGPQVEFFGFDAGQTADVVFTAHPPTGNNQVLLSDLGIVISSDPAGGAGGDPDVVRDYDLSAALQAFTPHEVHGWHVKLDITVYGPDGPDGNTDPDPVPGARKHKVFWVEGCGPTTNPTFSVTLAKTNDANGDATYSDDELAPSVGAAVPFRVVITNTGTGELTLSSLVDTWPGQAQPLDLLTLSGMTCTGAGGAPVTLAVGTKLAAGSVTTCVFTVAGYAPPAGQSLTDTVTVDTLETQPTGDTSIVTSPGGQIIVPPIPCVDNPNTPINECNPTTPPVPPVVITDVCPQTPGRQTLVESCVEVLPDEVTPPTSTPPTSTPPVPTTPPPTVAGAVVTRTLPQTGAASQDLAGFGAGLLLLGAGLVVTSRLRFRDA